MDVVSSQGRRAGEGPIPEGGAARLMPWKSLGLYVLALAALFGKPLWDWAVFSLQSDLFSHALLMPVVAVYLSRLALKRDNPQPSRSLAPALILGAAGLGATAAWAVPRWHGWDPPAENYLSIAVVSFLLLAAAGGFFFLGKDAMKVAGPPSALLVFMAPFPVAVTHGIEVFFQHTSAGAAYLLLKLFGTPVFRDGLVFQLPGIAIEVAEECSGIRSSLVLFITSLIAGQLFLKGLGRKMFLAFFVIPLAIVRNAIRIVTIALLCVHVSPDMIDSIIHKRGGPVFFAASLVPFFIALVWLRKTEVRRPAPEAGA